MKRVTDLKIGICSPVLVAEFKEYLNINNESHLNLGLGGDAVNKIILGLLRKGIKIEIFTLDSGLSNPIKLDGDQLSVNIFPLRGKFRGVDVFRKEISSLKNAINYSNVDIIHAHWSYEYAWATIKSEKPHLVTVRDNARKILFTHSDKVYRLLRYFMNSYVVKNAKNIVANSEYIQNYLKESWSKDVDVIPNSVDFKYSDIGERVLNKDNKKIISVNNGFSKLKNVKSLIIAFSKLRLQNDDVELILIGNEYGSNGKAYKWANKLNLTSGVKFLGKRTNDEVVNAMFESDILVHPSLEESFGNTLVEAMSVGTPVIGGEDSGAVPWVLRNGKAGILTDVTNTDLLADEIRKLLYSEDYWKSMSQKSIQNVEERFSIDKVVKLHLEKYHSLIEKE